MIYPAIFNLRGVPLSLLPTFPIIIRVYIIGTLPCICVILMMMTSHAQGWIDDDDITYSGLDLSDIVCDWHSAHGYLGAH